MMHIHTNVIRTDRLVQLQQSDSLLLAELLRKHGFDPGNQHLHQELASISRAVELPCRLLAHIRQECYFERDRESNRLSKALKEEMSNNFGACKNRYKKSPPDINPTQLLKKVIYEKWNRPKFIARIPDQLELFKERQFGKSGNDLRFPALCGHFALLSAIIAAELLGTEVIVVEHVDGLMGPNHSLNGIVSRSRVRFFDSSLYRKIKSEKCESWLDPYDIDIHKFTKGRKQTFGRVYSPTHGIFARTTSATRQPLSSLLEQDKKPDPWSYLVRPFVKRSLSH
ncbi:MAG: hypothetical protein CME31_15335 [Gimesia sp.]|uniref:Uncharacterized protein n=1 Tax=Gimesia maris TaxID=122 RepID=A0A3D3R3J3_9PLAN|nr:hypothetical protein [Gimesia sp.]HCO23434.1 hypothetical protein [Gimesia maris]|tara:strand:- start:30954 stop:31802 length:849 start_codon:yes stop_codon:yes gene_type:complete